MDPVRPTPHETSEHTSENPVVLPAKEARQGNSGTRVVAVLLIGIVLLVLAYIFIFSSVPPT